jgi:DSF synthase
MGSRTLGLWNLGGDLEFFAERIRNRDRAALTRDAYLCCDLTFTNTTVFDLPVVSIALVQGDARLRGFNLIVAEHAAKFASRKCFQPLPRDARLYLPAGSLLGCPSA